MDLVQKVKEKKILLVAHRGTCGGNIPCNSLPAFKAAIMAGADMVELDVERSADGVLFVQHPGVESVHLRMKDSIKRYPASVVDYFKLSNWDLIPTQYPILRLEDALEFLRGKCLINIDKFWENPKEIADMIHRLKMEDQVLIKTGYNLADLDAVEKYASDISYMVVAKNVMEAHEGLMKRKIRYVAIESIFESEEEEGASEEFLNRVHADGKMVYVNAIVFDYRAVLAAGHNDDISMTEDPELGWGWIADRGFDLIQTDFIYQCRMYLEQTGRRK